MNNTFSADDINDMHERSKALGRMQDVYLNYCRKEAMEVEIRLFDHTEISGVIIGFDQQVIVVAREGSQELVYKSAIVYIRPLTTMNYIFNDSFRSINQLPKRPAYNYYGRT